MSSSAGSFNKVRSGGFGKLGTTTKANKDRNTEEVKNQLSSCVKPAYDPSKKSRPSLKSSYTSPLKKND